MSYDTLESSTCSAVPFELFWFTLQPPGAPSQNWYLTSGDVSRTYLSNAYVPTTIRRTEVRQDNEMQSGSIQIYLPIDHPVAQLFAQGAPLSPVGVVLYGGHDGDPDVAVGFQGRVQSVRCTIECEMTCLPSQQAVKKRIPASVYQTQCNRVLYSSECGVPADGFDWNTERPTKFTASIASISADGKTIGLTFTGQNSNWWGNWYQDMARLNATLAYGFLTTSQGRTMMIVGHPIADVVQLKASVPGLAVGDQVLLHRGCGRTKGACLTFFVGNDGIAHQSPRMLGFEAMPQKNPFTEGLS